MNYFYMYICLMFLGCISLGSGYRRFVALIPNGDSVPDPCDVRLDVPRRERDIWIKVGHLPPALERVNRTTGKIPKNAFGDVIFLSYPHS